MGRTRGTNDVGGKDRADIATIGLGDDANTHGIETTGATTTTEPLAGVDGVLHGGMPTAASPYLGLGHDVHDAAAYRRMAPLSSNAHAGGSNNSGANVPPRFPPFSESYVDMSELRRELKVLSVRNNMPYYMHHSSPQRLEARCPTWKNRKEVPTSCEFVVAANRHTNGRVYVTRAHTEHSPSCPSIQNTTNYVSAAALMETAKPFMLKIADSVKPRDMANIMKEKFGVATSYMTAWRALTAFKQEKKHEETASFTKIGGYLHAFAKANEGTVVAFEHLAGSNNVFSRAFLCPKPLQQAILSCRAQLLLSVFLITSTNGGVVMTATAQDAMGDTVPVAIGIALTETEENWRFFLEKLREAIPDLENSITTLVYNRGPVLQQAAAAVFPKCVQSDAVDLFLAPSQTTMASALGSAPIPTNSLQWIEALCAKTPLMILVGWVSKVASTLFQRYEKYGKMSSEYPEEFHALLTQYETDAKDYDVVRISEHGYEVIDKHSGRQRIVDFAKRTCTCGEYEASRFPCLHVFLALSFAGMMRADVIPPIFLMKTLQALYVGRITPIDVGTVDSDGTTVPNPLPKARGRPRKIQQIQQVSDVKHDKLACSICGVKGHNKRTCKRLTSGNPAGLLAIDSEDQPFLGTYGDGMFNGVLASDQGHAPVVEGDGSPSAKRRRLGQAKTEDDENATTIV